MATVIYPVSSEAVGGTVGTGARIFIPCGFTPLYVRIVNFEGDCSLEWAYGMGDDKGFKLVAGAIDGGIAVGGGMITSGGITPTDQSDDAIGFYIGTDTDINVVGEAIGFIVKG